MFSVIAKLQKKPEAVRRHTAFLCAGAVTFVILILWFLTLEDRFEPVNARPVQEAPAPFESIMDELGDITNTFRNTLEEPQPPVFPESPLNIP